MITIMKKIIILAITNEPRRRIDSSSYKMLRNTFSNRRIKTKFSLLTKVSPSNVFLRENISDGNSLLDASISDKGQKFVKYNNAGTKSSFFLVEILTKVFNVQPAI